MRWPYEKIGVTTTRAFRNLLNKIIGDIGADMQEHKDRADNIQAQVDNLVADGDSSPEAAQARVGADGTNYTTLKQRLDTEHGDVTAQLADIVTLNIKALPSPLISAKGDGITDDTEAIQNAINYLASIGGGKLLFPKGVYMVSGDLQDPENYNCIIKLPWVDSHTDQHVTIQLEGSFIPVTAYSVTFSQPAYKNASIIYAKTIDPGTSTKASIFGSHKNERNGLTFIAKNLIFRQPNNPTLQNLQLRKVANVIIDNIVNDVDAPITNGVTVPTHPNAVAVTLPTTNNFGLVRVRNYYAVGYYGGIKIGEHTNIDNAFVQCCYRGYIFIQGGHLIKAGKILAQWCKYNLFFDDSDDGDVVANSSFAYVDIHDLDVEYLTTTDWALIQSIYDPGNHLYGEIKHMHEVLPGTGLVPTIITGCHNLYINRKYNQIDLETLATNGVVDTLTVAANNIYYFFGSNTNQLIINAIDASNLNTGDKVYFVCKNSNLGYFIRIYGNVSGGAGAFFPKNPFTIGADYQNSDVIIPFVCVFDAPQSIRHLRPTMPNGIRKMQTMSPSSSIVPYPNQVYKSTSNTTVTITDVDISNLDIGDSFYILVATDTGSVVIQPSSSVLLPQNTSATLSNDNGSNNLLVEFVKVDGNHVYMKR